MNRSTANWMGNTVQCHRCSGRVPMTGIGNDTLCRPCHQLAELFPDGEVNRRQRGHAFLTSEMMQAIPALYATESVPSADKTLYAHYFLGSHDWYVAELDPETGRAFSYCPGFPGEWGYVDLVGMEALVAGWNVIEREVAFRPVTVRELREV